MEQKLKEHPGLARLLCANDHPSGPFSFRGIEGSVSKFDGILRNIFTREVDPRFRKFTELTYVFCEMLQRSHLNFCQNILNETLEYRQIRINPRNALFVHHGIFDEFNKFITKKLGTQIFKENIWDWNLLLNGIIHPMKLIWIPEYENDEHQHNFSKYFSWSKFAYFWRENLAIYVAIQDFHLIQKFIHLEKLNPFIKRIVSDRSRKFLDDEIKMVEFEIVESDFKWWQVLDELDKFLKLNKYKFPTNRFIKVAFSYLEPKFLKFYDKPFYNPGTITQILLLLDYHREQKRKGSEVFNIFHLISMKMAIDDVRLEYENCEFHKLIDRTFQEMAIKGTYIKDRVFDLSEYNSDRISYSISNEIHQYLLYNFSYLFDRITVYSKPWFNIKLSENTNINRLLNYSCTKEITLYIDGQFLNVNSPEIILKIMHRSIRSNLKRIFLYFDTDHPWYYGLEDIKRGSVNIHTIQNGSLDDECDHYIMLLAFHGRNTKYFIENFLNWLQFAGGERPKKFDMVFFGTSFHSPFILKEMFVNDLELHDIELSGKLITALAHIQYNQIKLFNCHLTNDYTIFLALNKLEGVKVSFKFEPCLFEMIAVCLTTMFTAIDLLEFQFKENVIISRVHESADDLILANFKFKLNEDKSVVEMLDIECDRHVYLYDYLYDEEVFGTREDFEFYY